MSIRKLYCCLREFQLRRKVRKHFLPGRLRKELYRRRDRYDHGSPYCAVTAVAILDEAVEIVFEENEASVGVEENEVTLHVPELPDPTDEFFEYLSGDGGGLEACRRAHHEVLGGLRWASCTGDLIQNQNFGGKNF